MQANSAGTKETLAIKAARQHTEVLNEADDGVHSISLSIDALRRLGRGLLLVREELDGVHDELN